MTFRSDFWVPLSGLVLWFVASVAAIQFSDAGQFQRAGTIGIAAAIALFGFLRKRVSEASDLIALAHEDMRFDALKLAMLEKEKELLKLISSVSLQDIARPEFDNNLKEKFSRFEVNQAYLRERLGQRSSHIEQAKGNHSKLEHRVIATELSVLALATLQTGYGDLIVRAVSGGN